MEIGTIKKNRKQIILRLSGGLGNQLWQLAYAVQIKRKFKMEEILLETSSYQKDIYRKFELDSYDLPEYIKKCPNKKMPIFNIICIIYSKVRGIVFLHTKKYVNNKIKFLYSCGFFVTHNIPLEIEKTLLNNIYMYGYFQNYNNIKNIIDDLKKIIVPQTKKLGFVYKKYLKLIKESSKICVAISVRCGEDYKKLGWDLCDFDYFENSMQLFENANFLIFSDDVEEARHMFCNKKNVIFVPQLTPIEQLELMRKCSGFILSNSTFSYWGALLADKSNVQIVFPKQWFPHMQTKDAGILFGNYTLV